MFQYIDAILNKITMYRVVLYGLSFLVVYAFILSFFGILSYTPLELLISLGILVTTCYLSNWFFGKAFQAAVNIESQYISAFILFFVLMPPASIEGYVITAAAGAVAMASKYIIAIRHKHLLNPVAVALLILGLFGRGEGVWWVGGMYFFPLVLVFAFLVLRKLRRFSLGLVCVCAAVLTSLSFGFAGGFSFDEILTTLFISGPLLFFVGIMLTEPLTAPPTRKLQMLYGGIAGVLYGSSFVIGPVYSSPELALVSANVFSFFVSPMYRLILPLREKRQAAMNLYEFIFKIPQALTFKPGQYFEWTVPHAKADARGMRRYFTIASSPTEEELHLAVRIESQNSSTFKKALMNMGEGNTLMVSSLAGDFTLPSDSRTKLVFIAGGIGVTPFRSMVKYLIDTKQKRDIIFFYANRTEDEIAFKDLFDEAREFGIKMVYLVNETKTPQWSGYVGFLTKDIIAKEVEDFKERTFYISGSHGMVTAFKKILAESGVPSSRIHTDYFPGFA